MFSSATRFHQREELHKSLWQWRQHGFVPCRTERQHWSKFLWKQHFIAFNITRYRFSAVSHGLESQLVDFCVYLKGCSVGPP